MPAYYEYDLDPIDCMAYPDFEWHGRFTGGMVLWEIRRRVPLDPMKHRQ